MSTTSVFRTDRSKLAKFDRTGAGSFVVPGHFSRTGIQIYHDASGRPVREYRPAEEVFHPDSLASFRAVPVTIGHPKGAVNPDNMKGLTHGIVLDASGREKLDRQEYVRGSVVLMSTEAISGAESGRWAEISMGYTARLDATPGVTPDGEPYDVVQRDIRANHLALLPEGHARAGRQARLRLDGHEAIGDDGMEEEIKELKAQVKAASTRADAAEAQLQAAHDKVKATETELATTKAKADALEAEVAPLKTDAAKREIQDVCLRSAKVLGKDYKADGKTAHQIRLDAIKAAKRDVGDKSTNEGYVEAYFDASFDRYDYNQPKTKTDAAPVEKFDMENAWRNLGRKPETK